jgi:hypothetical protein
MIPRSVGYSLRGMLLRSGEEGIVGYDVIGDIHGQADKLEALLRKLGYVRRASGWVPPAGPAGRLPGRPDRPRAGTGQGREHRAIDDRRGHARSVMGNHEFNAIGYATPVATPGEFLRSTARRTVAARSTSCGRFEGSDLHRELIGWFKSLPPMLDLGTSASCTPGGMSRTSTGRRTGCPGRPMDDDFLHEAYVKGSPEWAGDGRPDQGPRDPPPRRPLVRRPQRRRSATRCGRSGGTRSLAATATSRSSVPGSTTGCPTTPCLRTTPVRRWTGPRSSSATTGCRASRSCNRPRSRASTTRLPRTARWWPTGGTASRNWTRDTSSLPAERNSRTKESGCPTW